jgi:UDP-GlcNAc:undecaprenyl-phosphate GlcNAc-1-phosphate transferase
VRSALLVICALSCLVSLALNWAARGLARRAGLVDRPDGHRKIQTQAIPLAGGIAIFATMLTIIAALMAVDPDWRKTVFAHSSEVVGLLVSGAIIVLVGIVDDFIGLRGRQKFFGQIVAAGVLVVFGVCIQRISVLGWSCDLGNLAVPFTIFWLVGAINALNLLDGIDGLAATLGVILSSAIAVAALFAGHESIALVAAVLAGSLVGFLRYNLPPASIYLGDAGSMLIGLAVGVMAIQASLKGPGTVLLGIPLALWTVPIFDSAAAILRRKLTGRSIYTTDRAHLHHHLMSRFGHRWTLTCIGCVSVVTSAGALLGVWWNDDRIAIICSVSVVLIFVSLKVFGHSELQLVVVKSRSFLRSVFLSRAIQPGAGWDEAVHLQGTRQWNLLWETLTEYAQRLEFVEIRLDLNLPILGEGYHASWRRPNGNDHAQHWRLDHPLMVDGRVLGYVKIVGDRGGMAGQNLEQLMELLEQVESHLKVLARPEPVVTSHTISSGVPDLLGPEPALNVDPRAG